VAAVSFLMELSFLSGRDRLPGLEVRTLLSV
jgi:adenine phosphoribosyltransferase